MVLVYPRVLTRVTSGAELTGCKPQMDDEGSEFKGVWKKFKGMKDRNVVLYCLKLIKD